MTRSFHLRLDIDKGSLETIFVGTHGADVPGADISSPWDFTPKVLVTFLQVPWERGSVEQRRVHVTI